ncbi:MAG TPA: XRE family transcriptional regulator [Eubacteriales bacterium]|nr:XRE family transcriptional regulator [Eubacteriales bacterium]
MYEHLGTALAALRKRWQLSQAEVAGKLTRMGIPVTNRAVSHWEQERTQPSAMQFLGLCAIYHVKDVLATFGEDASPSFAGELNREGREKVEEFARILSASGLFAQKGNVVAFEPRSLPVYDLPASAGTGVFLDGDSYEVLPAGPQVPVDANFGVRVSGDSMEPDFRDGQIAWVRRQPTLESGDIGIFLLNGQAYIKQWRPSEKGVRLISLNRAYAPIPVLEGDDLRTFGRVLS